MLVVFSALFSVCAVFVPGFNSAVNIEGLLLSVSTIGIIACTMLFCLASGAFDLSVGSVAACAGVATAVVTNLTDSVALGITAGLGLGALVGLVNGVLIAKGGINALIATLATMQIVRGLGYLVSGGKAVGVVREEFFTLGNSALAGLPAPVWICLGCFVFFGFLIERTTFGRNTLALGGNAEAARLAGIGIDRLKIAIFTLQGLLSALAGIVLASRMTSGQPTVAQGLELDVISACVLGGVSLNGGIGKMSHVIAGVLIMGTVRNAMNLLNVPTFYQYIASGLILLAAVSFDGLKQRGSRR
ncbi:MAG: Ribose transport system permease protein RbsC [Verrucomicrobiota bacterium]